MEKGRWIELAGCIACLGEFLSIIFFNLEEHQENARDRKEFRIIFSSPIALFEVKFIFQKMLPIYS
jgi:hypothetical protein